MQLNPNASNALKESQIHHIFQGLNEHKYLPSHPNYRISTLSNGTSIKKFVTADQDVLRLFAVDDCPADSVRGTARIRV